jgi:LuxR family maltose regulon positive regulatory protein
LRAPTGVGPTYNRRMAAPLAKLTPPRLPLAIRRERLHRLLDGGIPVPVVWFGAAAGSGKTTGAAEYLASRNGPVRWYRVDTGDRDLASFFYYLAQTAPHAKARKALPVFGPEYAGQTVAFARRFFRELFTRLPTGTAFVLDDLHEASATLLPAIVAIAIEELPPGFRLFLLSREQVPPAYAGYIATDRLRVADALVLRFDDDEADALLVQRLGAAADPTAHANLRARAQGWAAGLVLLSEQTRLCAGSGPAIPDGPGQWLFDYFAREVIERMSDADRRFMQSTALLPDFTANAAALVAERDDAATILDNLHRRQLFLVRLADRTPRYHYNDLFRAFLLEGLRRESDATTLRQATLRAAEAALTDDRIELAIELCLDAGAWDRASELLRGRAPALLQQGRRTTFRILASRLPATHALANPWLHYWRGVACMTDDAAGALVQLEEAHARFAANGDTQCMCLAAAQAVLAMYMNLDTHAGVTPWVRRLDQTAGAAAALAPADRLRVLTALLRAAAMDESYRVNEQSVAAEVENALQMLEDRSSGIDANERLLAADALQEHALHTGSPALFERTVAAATPYLADGALSPWARCHWLISFGLASGRRFLYRRAGFPYRDGRHALEDAWALAQREGLLTLRFAATNALINVTRAVGDDANAEALVARLGTECNPAHPIQLFYQMDQQAMQLAHRGRYADALLVLESARRAAERAQTPLNEWWGHWLARAQVLIGLGRCADALALMREHEAQFTGVFLQAIRIVAASAELWEARSRGAVDYVDRLRATTAEVRAMGWVNYLTGIPKVVSVVWADALELGIEREFVTSAIRRRRVVAPAMYAPTWPWPLRVRVLGPLEIERDDVPVSLGAKSPMRPLELLKVLVAAPSHRVDVAQIHAWLWPEVSGATAKPALDVVLHRLRKLLGHEEALTLIAGKLQLATAHVWVDAAAFEAWADEARRQLDAQVRAPTASVLAERLFADYRGRLFGDDEATEWSVGPRERLHSKFLQLVGALGHFYESRQDWAGARTIYERGLAQDALAEDFYRGIIRCELSLNEPARALHAFRRCREILSVVLGVAPAPATRALVAKVPGAGT